MLHSIKRGLNTTLLLIFLVPLILCGCKSSQKKQAINKLTEALHGDYSCEISFNIPYNDENISGNAKITRSMGTTKLDFLSPDPYSGMSIEYDVKGLPSSIAVHFEGIDTSIPKEALSRVNSVAMLFADDFVFALEKVQAESITEYELNDKEKGGCTSLIYNGADISLYFSLDTSIPLSLEYRSGNVNADIIFESFNPAVKAGE